MAIALQIVAGICFPLISVNTTNHKTQRAMNLRPRLNPGGVDSVVELIAVTWTLGLGLVDVALL